MADAKKDRKRPLPEEKREQEDFTPYKNEIILIVTLLASVLSLISILGVGGMVGGWLQTFIFGTMGILGYLFPFVLFFSVVFILSNYQNKRVLSKILCCIGIYFVLMGLFQLMFYADSTASLPETYFQSAKSTLGGGFFGALLAVPLSSAAGVAGACVILAALLLILLTFVTSRFLLSALGQNGKKKIHKIHQQYQAEQIERTVKKESYGKLPPRKRKPSVTFDLKEAEQNLQQEIKPLKKNAVLNGQELSPLVFEPEEKKQKKKAPKKKEPEMQEYEPVIEAEDPVLQGSKEIREELEHSILVTQEPEAKSVSPRPSIRFVESSKNNGYIRKTAEPEDTAVEFQDLSQGYAPVLEKTAVTEDVSGNLKEKENLQEDFELLSETPENIREEAEDVVAPVSLKETEQTLNMTNPYERFTPEKKFDGSVLEGIKEMDVLSGLRSRRNDTEPSERKTTKGPDCQVTIKTDLTIPSSQDLSSAYIFPPINLLSAPSGKKAGISPAEIQEKTECLRRTFESFKVRVKFGNVSCGPAVTRYEIQPEQGVKVSKITNLADDIKLSLAAADIRMEAPIPGKAAIGIEVPNKETSPVILRELLENEAFRKHKSNIAFAVGKDVGGQPVITDIAKMPHLLIAGATGSGKSVCINTLIMSILYKAHPDDVKLIMIDPKVVELSVYNGIPHLLIPVVTDPKKASAALNWAVTEMTDRYGKFAELGVRDLTGYNQKIAQAFGSTEGSGTYKKLPQIVIIVDELADLMMVAPGEVEDAICRLAQMARAAGLHLVIATQRPSVNVITGVIKANVPSRIAFSVSSSVDSRTIIDGVGAEKLLGKGDMLFFPSGLPKPIRVQGAFVSDNEVSRVVEFLREQNKTHSYDSDISEKITASASTAASGDSSERDEYFAEAGKFIIEKDKASIGMLQRVYKIGFNRAARIMDQLSDAGVVGPEEGTKPRKILMSMEEFEAYLEEYL